MDSDQLEVSDKKCTSCNAFRQLEKAAYRAVKTAFLAQGESLTTEKIQVLKALKRELRLNFIEKNTHLKKRKRNINTDYDYDISPHPEENTFNENNWTEIDPQNNSQNESEINAFARNSTPFMTTPIPVNDLVLWVQCDDCAKWRKIEQSTGEVPEYWNCSMNPDFNFNSCAAPQEITSDMTGIFPEPKLDTIQEKKAPPPKAKAAPKLKTTPKAKATPKPKTTSKSKATPKPKAKAVPKNQACKMCGTTKTPEWRKDETGVKTLCNACGLRFRKQIRKQRDYH